ncbi:GFA family protein [Sphingomonas sp. MMS24-J13]|uniref:GFA family protein n=1 Tax=Sphingomonas sp. MMS24-J13 TaxID=3238686 RepID=UPI00384D8176
MRTASCRCGQLKIHCVGDPVRISVCHCLACQQRTGSAFSVQARWPDAQVTIDGEWCAWDRIAERGNRSTYRFCPVCGSTVAYAGEGMPGLTAVAVGAFADPDFPAPKVSVYEERRHRWTQILGDDVEHID